MISFKYISIILLIDEYNNENVPAIDVRIDFPQGDSKPPPVVTVKAENRTIGIATHAIDVILQNLEEVHTREEKSLRKSRPHTFVPIDVHLNNVQLSLEVYSVIFFLFNKDFCCHLASS